MTFDEQVDKFTSLLADTLKRKNADYGDSFNQQYKKYGMTSSLIRLEDKQRRLENLVLNGNQQVDESIDDTLLDVSGYAILTLISRSVENE